MSEQAEAQTDGQSLPAAVIPTPEPTETEQATPQKNDDYQGRVDLTALPDDVRKPVEARFNVLTKKLGNQERRFNSELTEWRKVAEEQSRIIEELQSGVGLVVDHLQDKSLNDAEIKIMARMEEAQASGDTKAFVAAQKDLAKLEAKRIVAEERKSAPKQAPKTNAQTSIRSAGDAADRALADGEINTEERMAISTWQQERDESGNMLRPWAISRTPDNPTNDPYYRRALIESAAVFDESSPWADKTIAEKLAEVDRRMGVSRPTSSQTVMGGSLTTQRKNAKVTLTPNQERIAIRTKFGGPKAKSDAEHLEAFRQQIAKVNQKRGVR